MQLVGILRASVPLFKDIGAFKDFKGQVEELVHKLDAFQKDQFQVGWLVWFLESDTATNSHCLSFCLLFYRSGVTPQVKLWRTASCR